MNDEAGVGADVPSGEDDLEDAEDPPPATDESRSFEGTRDCELFAVGKLGGYSSIMRSSAWEKTLVTYVGCHTRTIGVCLYPRYRRA